MIVERNIRSLRYVLRRAMEIRKTADWVSLLQECVDIMNSRKHKSTGMRPKDVNFDNAGKVFAKLYPDLAQDRQPSQNLRPNFRLGQRVRVIDKTLGRKFAKGDIARGSSEVYRIGRILFGPTITYNLKELETESFISDSYQESELVAID